jgi:hypothetical protein
MPTSIAASRVERRLQIREVAGSEHDADAALDTGRQGRPVGIEPAAIFPAPCMWLMPAAMSSRRATAGSNAAVMA